MEVFLERFLPPCHERQPSGVIAINESGLFIHCGGLATDVMWVMEYKALKPG